MTRSKSDKGRWRGKHGSERYHHSARHSASSTLPTMETQTESQQFIQSNVKDPPHWSSDGPESWEDYEKRLDVWEVLSSKMPVSERGPALAQKLGGEAGKMALDLGAAVLSQLAEPISGRLSGYDHLKTLLRNEYGAEEQNEVIDALMDFFTARRERNESMTDWKIRFNRILREAERHGAEINVLMKVFMYLYFGNVTKSDINNLLIPSKGKLPTDEEEEKDFLKHMKRTHGLHFRSDHKNFHVDDKKHSDHHDKRANAESEKFTGWQRRSRSSTHTRQTIL